MELIIQTFLFVVTFILLFKRDRFCSLFYAALFIYLLPVEVMSGYLPFLLRDDFGSETYMPFLIFSTLSLFGFWTYVYSRAKSKRTVSCVREVKYSITKNTRRVKFVYCLIIVLLLTQALVIALSFNDISYQNLISVDYKKTKPLLVAGTNLFMYSKYVSLLLLFKHLVSTGPERKLSLVLFLWSLGQNFLYGTLAGSRSGLLAIVLAIGFAIFGYQKVSLKNIIKLGAVGFIVLVALQQVRNLRSEEAASEAVEYAILQNDYAAPGQLTLAAIKYDAVDPIEVIVSNVCRSFPLASYPYLYLTMTEIFLPGMADEANSMGFYIFSEGYMFGGMLGFLYNAIVIGALLMYWRRMGRTNNILFNLFILSLMISCFFGMVRAQSVWFIRYLWLSIIPMVFLYSWFMNVTIDYKRLLLPRNATPHKKMAN